jgi:hypothetical protein
MGLIIMFFSGVFTGIIGTYKVDEYKDYKIERLEEILEIDKDYNGDFLDNRAMIEDHFGQIWLVEPYGCTLVL